MPNTSPSTQEVKLSAISGVISAISLNFSQFGTLHPFPLLAGLALSALGRPQTAIAQRSSLHPGIKVRRSQCIARENAPRCWQRPAQLKLDKKKALGEPGLFRSNVRL